MLNSQDLEQLKIQALMDQSHLNQHSYYFLDVLNVFTTPSSEHVILKNTSNSNILAFSYLLLTHIFDPTPLQTTPSGSASSKSNSGSGSKKIENLTIPKGKESESDSNLNNRDTPVKQSSSGQKLGKFYQFILKPKINMGQITNIPERVNNVLLQHFKVDDKNYQTKVNLFLKKMLIQFIKTLKAKQSKRGLERSLFVSNLFNKFSVCETLFCIFIRCILYYEYEIVEALDYTKTISDHTVYTALSDAFEYTSLRIEQGYTEVSHNSFIRTLRLKGYLQSKASKSDTYYLVSLPLYSGSGAQFSGNCADTFRNRRKSSDITSNCEGSVKSSRKKSDAQKKYNNSNIKIQQAKQLIQSKNEPNPQNQIAPTFKTPQQFKISENVQPAKNRLNEKISGMFPQKLPLNQEINQINKVALDLNGYTNIELLNHLSPKVRDSMLKNLSHYKNIKV